MRTSNLLDLLGCVVHELSPSALVFFHPGHGLGGSAGLRDVLGFDGVHCEEVSGVCGGLSWIAWRILRMQKLEFVKKWISSDVCKQIVWRG